MTENEVNQFLEKTHHGSIQSLELDSVLETTSNYNFYLVEYLKRIKLNGQITIKSIDIYELSRQLLTDVISLPEYNSLISGKHSFSGCENVITLLKQNNFKIDKIICNQINFFIQATRNE